MSEATEQKLSKRALKRLAKQREDTEASSKEQIIEPAAVESSDKFTEYVQKRMRNLQKRKQKLDKYQEIADSGDNTLNADQLAVLADKSSVEAPLKELAELLPVYKTEASEREQELKKIQQEHEAALKRQVDVTRETCQKEAKDAIDLTLRFLRAASIKRSIAASVASGSTEFSPVSQQETAGFESLLRKLYAADEDSLKSVDLLVAGNSIPVDEDTVTYEIIKAVSKLSVQELYDSAKKPEPFVKPVLNGHLNPLNGGINSSLQISFLQEEVVDDDDDQDVGDGECDDHSEGTTVTEVLTAEATPEPTEQAAEASPTEPASKKKSYKKWNKNKKNKQNQGTVAA